MKKQKPNNSNDWESRFIKAYEDNGWFIASDDQKPIIDFISSELRREREKVLEEVKEIIGKNERHNKWVGCGKPEEACYVCNRNELRHELLSKINKLK